MRAVVLNGALEAGSLADHLGTIIINELERRGFTVDAFVLRDLTMAHCQGCFACWLKTPGICKADDEGRAVCQATVTSDVAVYVTPVVFGGYSSQLKKALDKMLGLLSPLFEVVDGEVHHRKRYARYPALLAIGAQSEGDSKDEATIFEELVRRNAVNMHAPAWKACVVKASDAPALFTTLQAFTRELKVNL